MKDKNNLAFIDKVIICLNIVLSLALIISYFAPVVDPKIFWEFAFFGLAYPFLLMANVIMAVYWFLRKKRYWLLPVVCIFCGWRVLSNTIGFHASSGDGAPADSAIIRVMTYNVHNFKRYGAANDTSTKHEILGIINHQQPDIIGFQEFYSRTHGQYDMRDSIAKILGHGYYYFEPVIYNSTEAIGIAIFSKLPIIDHGFIPLSDRKSENACIYIDVKKGDRQFRFYSVHLQSIRFDPEDYKYINSITHQGKTDISSTRRLGSKLKTAFIKRSSQVMKIKGNAAQCPYPYLITGDFNDTPASYAVNYMEKGLKNAFREKGSGFGQTYNGSFPNFQIDYIMSSPQFDIKNYFVTEKKLSDHYPVRSDVSLVH
ncbi:endonuclease/exonuclease/phosphatase family protein [Mucilaginibacter sp.]|uniref:endonuclease/exonuclease/phosphatase family protein n=1 Tax=Mucilaginibacter sp. TaxID=1882438 RepID=UPI0028498105|nr:endonuclease/exonuclease/phosphatase family protein [Mucilaginibacter sp.]MDR3696882.1 endonuclease/exonuclease/phosphatase family protein [Mucilaginibacter sp.]